ncbi:MAG: hypothetical protein LBK42_04145 [Propionibacteriaceae bacterium]|jgi:hypothetical protein|nr:hypothetical protein [Propionibacteriaceae bacterium]
MRPPVPKRHTAGWLVALAVVVVAVVVWGVLSANRRDPAYLGVEPHCQATLADGRQASLTLEQAANASLIAGVAATRSLEPRAVSIALATAFQESGIRNLDYGDLDSLGLFQQRPAAGWGTPEEIMNPYYSTNKFFDAMVQLPNWAWADIGDIAQEIQRSAFPDAYDQHVERARILASALSGQTEAAWSCHVPQPGPADPDGLAQALSLTYGWVLTAIESSPADPENGVGARTAFQAASPAAAWSAAAFALARASDYGVRQVEVGQADWTGQPDVLAGWTRQATGADPASLTIVYRV